MKAKVFAALAATAIAILVLGYLTLHYYPLAYGQATGQSFCSISAKFDCDAVAVSSYAAWFGIPVAAWGAAFFSVLFVLILLAWWGVRGDSNQAWREAFWTSLIALIASAGMAAVSFLFLPTFCLFCMLAWVGALVAFLALWLAQPESPWKHLGSDFSSWMGPRKTFLYWLALAPLGAGFIHIAMTQANSDDRFDKMVMSAIDDWTRSKSVEWTATPSLIKGASIADALMVVTEFADFRCGHCRAARPGLAAFAKANPNVRMIFYTFALDGACNPKVSHADGVSCALAKAVVCAERQSKGWDTHDAIFENQSFFQTAKNPDETVTQLKERLANLNLDWASMDTCMKDPETEASIRAQAEQGDRAGVQGTPTIYVNGRKLEMGQSIRVLNKVRDRIAAEK